jgi:hypothetical protein
MHLHIGHPPRISPWARLARAAHRPVHLAGIPQGVLALVLAFAVGGPL